MATHPDAHAVPDESVLRPFRFRSEVLRDETARIRSEARLEQILATPPQRVPQTVDVPRRRRSRRAVAARWAVVPVAAAVIVGAGIALPPEGVTLPGGITVPGLRGPRAAFASWTPDPSPVPSSDLVVAAETCRAVGAIDALEAQREADVQQLEAAEQELLEAAEQQLLEAVEQKRAAAVAAAERAAAESRAVVEVTADGEELVVATVTAPRELVAAEQRGTWPVLVFDGAESRDFCVLEEGDGSGPRVAAFASIGNPVVAADGSVTTSVTITADEPSAGTLTVTDDPAVQADGIMQSTSLYMAVTGEGGLTIVDGYAGRDVLAVVVHTGDGEDVAATVSGGRFVAWWPTSATAASYSVTLRDGTELRVVQPSR